MASTFLDSKNVLANKPQANDHGQIYIRQNQAV